MEPNQGPYTIFRDGKYHCVDCKKVIGNTKTGMKIHITKIHEPEPGTPKKHKNKSKKKVHHDFTMENKKLCIKKVIQSGWSQHMLIKEHYKGYEACLKARNEDPNYPSMFVVKYDNDFYFSHFCQKNNQTCCG